jgi:hypothetical protein
MHGKKLLEGVAVVDPGGASGILCKHCNTIISCSGFENHAGGLRAARGKGVGGWGRVEVDAWGVLCKHCNATISCSGFESHAGGARARGKGVGARMKGQGRACPGSSCPK